jgi:hypothetical protein
MDVMWMAIDAALIAWIAFGVWELIKTTRAYRRVKSRIR